MPEIFVAEAYAKAKEFQDTMYRLGYQTHVQVFIDDMACVIVPRGGMHWATCDQQRAGPAVPSATPRVSDARGPSGRI